MQKLNINRYFLILISLCWILWGLFLLFSEIRLNYKDYKLLSLASLEDKRAITTGLDFYQFLVFCNEKIPIGKDIQWVLPAGDFLGNDVFYFYKTYYYLYPRNYKEGADYIIVYGRAVYIIPVGYRLLAQYGKVGCIISRY